MQPVAEPRTYSGRYQLTHLIARGGMAQVYRAMDRQLDRPVALKVLFPELSIDLTFVERFRREAQAAANLSHPNIVPVFDWGEDDGAYFIVMEYVEGRPLSAVLRDPQRLPPVQIAMIGAGVAAALAFAHRHGVIHRDVKPGNVLITPDGDVKVTDFGIARAVNTEESLTQTGAVMGTAAYFSPEQAEGKGVDARSDIYSLGVVLYEMAVGRPPFTGDSPVAVASKHVRDTPVLPREANPAVPVALEAVVMMAWPRTPTTGTGRRRSSGPTSSASPMDAPSRPPTPVSPPSWRTVGATRAVPVASSTMAIPVVAGGPPPDDGSELERKKTDAATHRAPRRAAGRARRNRLLLAALRRRVRRQRQRPQRGGRPAEHRRPDAEEREPHRGHDELPDQLADQGDRPVDQPTAGASVSKNSAVNLVVSDGPNIPIVTVPSVKGQQLTAAISALQGAGLTYRVNDVTSTQPVGTVLDQSPAGGSKVKATVPVVLTVSGTQTSVPVPSVLGPVAGDGRRHSQGRPERRQPEQRVLEPVPTGVVSSQSPVAGHHVPAQHGGQPRHLDRQLRLGAQRRRPVGQRGPVGHHGRRPRGQHDHRHHVRRRGAARQRRQPEPRRQHPGDQRQHGDHLGLPAGDHHHDHDDDHTVVDDDDHRRTTPRTPSAARRRAADGLRPGAASGSGAPSCPRKLASSAGPDAVRTDSGWNWTPSTASVRWRRPMTTPSVEVAVTSSSSGTESGRTTSEW